jgi:hypothetical protein
MTQQQVKDDDEGTRTSIHASGRIRTHGLGVHAIKADTSDHVATGTGNTIKTKVQNMR